MSPNPMFSQDTPNGYAFAECVSALQKCIRISNYRDAVFFAREIASCGRKEQKYLWNRLRVINSEDVGPTPDGNSMVLLIAELQRSHEDAVARGNHDAPLFLIHAVMAMCAVPKSRINDNMKHIVSRMDLPPIPDNALDKHTRRGKIMGRGLEHWLTEGARVEPQSDYWGEADEEIREEAYALLRRAYPERSMPEQDEHGNGQYRFQESGRHPDGD